MFGFEEKEKGFYEPLSVILCQALLVSYCKLLYGTWWIGKVMKVHMPTPSLARSSTKVSQPPTVVSLLDQACLASPMLDGGIAFL